jgi:hypothetical protein
MTAKQVSAFLTLNGVALSGIQGGTSLNSWKRGRLFLKIGNLMDDRQIEERKEYLALQAFYLKVKKLVEETNRKLNPAPKERGRVIKLYDDK